MLLYKKKLLVMTFGTTLVILIAVGSWCVDGLDLYGMRPVRISTVLMVMLNSVFRGKNLLNPYHTYGSRW